MMNIEPMHPILPAVEISGQLETLNLNVSDFIYLQVMKALDRVMTQLGPRQSDVFMIMEEIEVVPMNIVMSIDSLQISIQEKVVESEGINIKHTDFLKITMMDLIYTYYVSKDS